MAGKKFERLIINMLTISEALRKARDYEKEFSVTDALRPVFHVTAPVGWMNDPNGFSIFNNQYHLFYQYHPYSTHWGPMHWGHFKSDNLIHWEPLPCALAPDAEYDKDGCFSGTALEYEGNHILMYTGVSDGNQAQCIAVGDGVDYYKIPENPVIDLGLADFRDPKIWHDGDSFRAIIAHRGKDDSGELVEYMSHDLKRWDKVSIIDRSDNRLGKMWECPDAFYLDGRKIVLLSAQEMEGKVNEFHPGNVGVYLLYNEDGQREISARAIDFGLDFYAPQTLETADGRRIMIAWAQNWENYLTPGDFRYSGIMTFPRELSLLGDKLFQTPIRELDNFIKKSDKPNCGRVFDLRIEAETKDWFSVKLASDGNRYTEIKYDHLRNTLTVDRTYSGIRKDALHSRTYDLYTQGERIDLRILMDRYIMEVFVNGDEQVFTCLLYTPLNCDKISYGGNNYSYEAVKYDVSV